MLLSRRSALVTAGLCGAFLAAAWETALAQRPLSGDEMVVRSPAEVKQERQQREGQKERKDWEQALAANNEARLNAFLAAYPDGAFSARAREEVHRLARIRTYIAGHWQLREISGHPDNQRAFLIGMGEHEFTVHQEAAAISFPLPSNLENATGMPISLPDRVIFAGTFQDDRLHAKTPVLQDNHIRNFAGESTLQTASMEIEARRKTVNLFHGTVTAYYGIRRADGSVAPDYDHTNKVVLTRSSPVDTPGEWTSVAEPSQLAPLSQAQSRQLANPGIQTCFIATAAYGTPSKSHVVTLRRFRERWLLTNGPGRYFVETYYLWSPAMAERIAKRPWAKGLARLALAPVVLLAGALLGQPSDLLMLASCLGSAGALAYWRRKRRARRTTPTNPASTF